jgi:glycosyltransferase involved in cell wall biosynthesis
MIAQVIAPAQIGGLETVVGQLLRSAHDAREPMACVALMDEAAPLPAEFEALHQLDIPIVRLAAPHRQYVTQYRSVVSALRGLHARVAHTHGAHADVLGGLAARSVGIPQMSTLHGFIDGGRKQRLFEWLQLRQLRSAAAVVAVSSGIVERACRAGVPGDRIHLIPNAAPESPVLSRSDARERLGLPAGGAVIGWVGRVSHEKGPEAFVDVIAALQGDPEIMGVMIGDGPRLPAVRELGGALISSGRLRLLGSIAEARQLLSAFDVLALTSVTEGTPMVVLEAMRAGVPVVSTQVGGVPALLADGAGSLVEYGDWTAFARAVEAVLFTSGMASRIREHAFARVRADYALDRWWERYDDLYQRLNRR